MVYSVLGSGEPLVLVHGLSGSTRWWSRVTASLATDFRVYLVDLPGFGTARLSTSRLVMADTTGWLGMWMQAAGLESAHFVGHSMGGYVCLRLAAEHPELVRRLVLVAPATLPPHIAPLRYGVGLLREARRLRLSFLLVAARDALLTRPAIFWGALRQLLAGDAATYASQVSAPTLLVWGALDTVVPPALGYELQQRIPGARMKILRGAGHVPMFDQPRQLSRVILEFLRWENGPLVQEPVV